MEQSGPENGMSGNGAGALRKKTVEREQSGKGMSWERSGERGLGLQKLSGNFHRSRSAHVLFFDSLKLLTKFVQN